MTATAGAADGRQDSPDLAEPLRTEKTSRSGSRQPSPATSVDLQPAPDAGERPVREQLKNTSITATETDPSTAELPKPDDTLSEAGSVVTDAGKSDKDGETSSARGRPRRKRSFEELGSDHVDGRVETLGLKHLRKRSREGDDMEFANEASHQAASTRGESPAKKARAAVSESTAQEGLERPMTPPPALPNTALPPEDMAISPQNKRTRDQFVKDQDSSAEKTTVEGDSSEAPAPTETSNHATMTSKAPADEPESKRPRDEAVPQPADKEPPVPAKVPPSSGFANSSAQSPFAALASPKSPSLQPETSTSAFASSGFASFASSTQSPFGTFGAKPPAEDTKAKPEMAKLDAAPVSGFGALGGQTKSPFASSAPSAFGSQSSGFGKLSNGLGTTGGFGGSAPLSSFANPGSSGIIGANVKAPKPIGAPAEADDNEDAESTEEGPENGDLGPPSTEDGSKDARFYEQELETGEEGEVTIFSNRAKLYVSQEKQWKERGVGTFKVNVAYDQEDGYNSPKKSARFIMRADGSHRIVLNSPIKKQITIEDPTGGPPKGKTAIFLGFIDDKPTMMQLKMRSNVQTEELYSVVTTLQGTL